MEYNCKLISNGEINTFQKELETLINEVKLENILKINIDQLILFDDYEGMKHYFKLGLKKYKEAQEILKLDGFVTEYVEIQKQKIGLYKNTYPFEKEKLRIKAIEDRIEEMILSVRSELNEKYFKK